MLKIKHSSMLTLEHNDLPLSLDPLSKGNTFELNFVSHSHKDHINLIISKGKEPTYLATSPTLEIMSCLFNTNFNSQVLELNKTYNIDDLYYKAINAGHVLGGCSLVLEHKGTKTVVTSDINTKDTTTTKATVPEDTDVLIIESTYGNEKKEFPNRKDEYTRFLKWLLLNKLNNKLPIISAYTFGKTQEIAKLISDNTNLAIGMTNKAFEITEIYNKHNIKIKNCAKVNGNINDLDVLILPQFTITKNFLDAISTTSKKMIALASTTGQKTGWGENFIISDHCDISGLLDYIRKSNAKEVYTYHGQDKELAEIIKKKLQIDAKPLKNANVEIN